MSNITVRGAHAVKRHWRRAALVTAATAGVVVISAGTGYTAALVTSADIRNQTISQADVGRGGVSGNKGTGNSEIERQSVGQANIADPGVDTSEIVDGGIALTDVAPDAQEQLKGEPGEQGPAGLSAYEVAVEAGFEGTKEEWLASLEGPKGDQGEQGPPGPPGVSGYEVIGHGEWRATEPGTYTVKAHCFNTGGDDPHKVALSGGVRPIGNAADVTVHGSHPSDISMIPGSKDEVNPHGLWQATSWTVSFTIAEGSDTDVQPHVLCAAIGEAQE